MEPKTNKPISKIKNEKQERRTSYERRSEIVQESNKYWEDLSKRIQKRNEMRDSLKCCGFM